VGGAISVAAPSFSARGTLNVTGCAFSDNGSGSRGGAIGFLKVDSEARLNVVNSTFDGNVVGNSQGQGGGISIAAGEVSIANSSFTGNEADIGGGLSSAPLNGIGFPNVSLTNCRFSGNLASRGAAVGVDAGGSMSITNSTISANITEFGSAVY